jgi:hypothetical protein
MTYAPASASSARSTVQVGDGAGVVLAGSSRELTKRLGVLGDALWGRLADGVAHRDELGVGNVGHLLAEDGLPGSRQATERDGRAVLDALAIEPTSDVFEFARGGETVEGFTLFGSQEARDSFEGVFGGHEVVAGHRNVVVCKVCHGRAS